jgi:Mce-associated membrane protein
MDHIWQDGQMATTLEESSAETDAATDESVRSAAGTPPRDASEPAEKTPLRERKRFAFRWTMPVASALLGASLAGNVIAGWQWHSESKAAHDAHADLSASREAADARKHAEQVSIDYAKGAAEMDYRDLPAWSNRLTANTTPALRKKLTEAATSMEQIIVPLQWVSTPTPIAAAVRSEHDGVFVVNCFVSVVTKNIQAPNGIQSTATYTVTLNKNDNWVITDVGGVDSATKLGS